MHRPRCWALARFLACVAATGCGSGSDALGADTGSSGGEATPPTTSPAASTGTTVGASQTGDETAAPEGSVTGSATTQAASTTSADADSGSTSTGTDTEADGSGSSSTGQVLPFPCDNDELPVHVVGGGDYATIGEGVFATPPGGTVQICPGEYTESEPIYLSHDMTIAGAGSDLVSLTSTAGFVAGMFAGGAFEVELANIEFEGFSVQGGRYGFYVYTADDNTQTVFRDVDVSATDDSAIYILHDVFGADANAEVAFENVVVRDVVGTNAFDPHSAIRLHRATAVFTDCQILDTSSDFGGLHVEDSVVTFAGGVVQRNAGIDGQGGGAFLRETGAPTATRLDIVDSDWGAGADVENTPADVDCGFPTDVGWLGAPANATCEVGPMCCTAN